MRRVVHTWLAAGLLALGCDPAFAHAAEFPLRLRDTGLYAEGSSSRLHDGVLPFSPQYPLWSDGAAKRRWIYLPPGTSIDASNPDAWDFPRGTKLWKEFSHDRAIETRYIERGMDGEWRFASYVWNADGSDALLAPPNGIRELAVPGAPGGRYAIPARDDCRACHEGAPVPVLGFSALQLSPDRDRGSPHAEMSAPVEDLRSLVARGLLRNLPAAFLSTPPRIQAATADERAALGYLHGNCGHCHNDDGPLAVLEMTFAQRVGAAAPSTGAVLRSTVDVPSALRIARVAPGHPEASALVARMHSREPLQQMPPLGTSAVDAEAMTLISRWIESLSSPKR